MRNKILLSSLLIALALGLSACGTQQPVKQEVGGKNHNTMEDFAEGISVDGTTIISGAGAISGTNGTFSGQLNQTPGTISATTTLTTSDENIQFLNASAVMETITLPAVATAGTSFRFQVDGALTGTFARITSAEQDNISGTLIVAGAVVDCRDEDYINIITDGEVIGDYVELISNGTQWLLVDSGVLTAGKMTCTDPS